MDVAVTALSVKNFPDTPQPANLKPVSGSDKASSVPTRPKRRSIEMLVSIFALLRAKPQSVRSLSLALGYESIKDSVYHYIDELHDKGLIYVADWHRHGSGGSPFALYALQRGEPYETPDAPRPRGPWKSK
jgi:hypothetical protein